MKIGNNPQKQLYENTKDIEYLLERVREAFRFNGVLSPTDTTCARNGITANFGYILDNDANLFKFNDGDSSTLLIQYLTNIKGVKGDSGSQYVVEANPEEDATEDLNKIKIDNTVYNVVGSGGSGKYIHNIFMTGQLWNGNSGQGANIMFAIEDDSELPYVKDDDYVEGTNQKLSEYLKNYGAYNETDPSNDLNNNNFNQIVYPAIGANVNCDVIYGICYCFSSIDNGMRYMSYNTKNNNGIRDSSPSKWNGTTLTDKIKPKQ